MVLALNGRDTATFWQHGTVSTMSGRVRLYRPNTHLENTNIRLVLINIRIISIKTKLFIITRGRKNEKIKFVANCVNSGYSERK